MVTNARLYIFLKKGQWDLWMIWLWIARKLEEPCNRKEKENNIKLSSKSQESIISICRCWNLNCRGGNSIMGELYKGWLPWGQLGSEIGKEDEERKDMIEFPTDSVECWKCRNVVKEGQRALWRWMSSGRRNYLAIQCFLEWRE